MKQVAIRLVVVVGVVDPLGSVHYGEEISEVFSCVTLIWQLFCKMPEELLLLL